MIILITGTPGTGKSTTAQLVAEALGVQNLRISDLIDKNIVIGRDEERESLEIDIGKLYEKIKKMELKDTVIDGHLSHLLPFEDAIVIVLRARPEVLEERLKAKGFNRRKIKENLEAEAIDVCLIESFERHKKVYEIDTSELSPEEVIEAELEIISGKGESYLPGKIDWSGYFLGQD